jgi:hypothetical protein
MVSTLTQAMTTSFHITYNPTTAVIIKQYVSRSIHTTAVILPFNTKKKPTLLKNNIKQKDSINP